MTENIKLRDVTILLRTAEGAEYDNVTVGIGDGSTVFDHDYEFDARVYFYFENEEEFKRAHTTSINFGFQIISETD